MPSNQERVRKNYKCELCKGTGRVHLYTFDNLYKGSINCGWCKGSGINTSIKSMFMNSLEPGMIISAQRESLSHTDEEEKQDQ